MDRSTILHNTTIQSYKKSNECEKFTESFLCDEIHDNLRTLGLIYPFSDEFRDVFEKRMFIKPNAKAFPHVMKYLLTICDVNEFKKKFCWPIYNKAAEATFRNSTLELLNKLNARYSLGFGEVKNKILIFPGGMDFMRVIYELSRLSIELTLKRNGVADLNTQPSITLSDTKKHLDSLEEVCDFVMDFKKKIQNYSVQMKAKTELMHKLLETVTKNTNIDAENILHDRFAESWNDVHNEIVDRGIEPEIDRLLKFQDNCQQLEEKISAMFKQQTLQFDTNALSSFSVEMQKLYPQYYQQMTVIGGNGRIDLENMLKAFKLALPLMLQSIECYKPPNIEAMDYESKQLRKLSQKTMELLQRILQLSEAVDMEKVKEPEKCSESRAFDEIQSMILSTPTISHETHRRAEIAAMQSKRLSLLEDAYQLRPSTASVSLKPLLSVLEESQNQKKIFLSPTRLFSKESKSKLDPMAMLSSITKKAKIDKNSSSGILKPKGINFGQRNGGTSNLHENSRVNDTILSVPDFSSTLLNQSHDFKEIQFNVDEQINTSLAKSTGKSDRQMRSVLAQDIDSSNCDVNRSPSGRLEALVLPKVNISDIKPMKVVKMHLDGEEVNKCITPSNSSLIGKMLTKDLSNIENNQNASNACTFNLNNMIDENDESLLNIIDRILNDFNDLDLEDSTLS